MRLEILYDSNNIMAILQAQISSRKKGLRLMTILFSTILILVPGLLIVKFSYVSLILGLFLISGILYAIIKLGRNAYRKLKALEYGLKKIESGQVYSLVIDGNSISIPYPLLDTGYGPKAIQLEDVYRLNIDDKTRCLLVICINGPVIRHKTIVIVWKNAGGIAYRPIDSKYFSEPIEKIADALVNNNVPVELAWSVVHPSRIDYWAMLAGQIPGEIRKLERYNAGNILADADIPKKNKLLDKPSQPLPKTP